MRAGVPGRWALAMAGSSLVGACAGASGSAGVSGAGEPEQAVFAAELGVDLTTMERIPAGLYMQDLRMGDGFTAQRSSLVAVRYVGYLPDGTVFDATGQGEPFQFRLGANEVVRGWNLGIPGMRVGGIRRLVVGPRLGYGSRGRGRVPPNTTMIFDVQLVDVR